MVLPLIAIHVLGERVNGYFTLVWTISSIVRSVLIAASVSLLAEGARDPALLTARLFRTAAFLLAIVAVTTLPMILFPRWLMLPFGREYVDVNALALPLFALSTLPSALFTIFVARERILFRVRYILLLTAVNGIVSTGLPYWGASMGGYSGFALGFLISQCILGLSVLPFLLPGSRPAAAARGTGEAG
jgi:O-antigen/teichoic acid export membrane protein